MREADVHDVFGWVLDAYAIERTGRPMVVLLGNAKAAVKESIQSVADEAQADAMQTCDAIDDDDERKLGIRRMIATAAIAKTAADRIAKIAGYAIRIDTIPN